MRLLLALVVMGLVACSGLSPRKPRGEALTPVAALPEASPVGTAGAIYKPGTSRAFFEDAKARNVGDLVTILLVENTAAQKKAATSTSKTGSVEIADVSLFGQTLGLGAGVRGSRDFAGTGDSTQSNRLEGSVTAVVIGRLPSGLLHIRGDKQIELNQGSEVVRIEGLVRPIDLSSTNTVASDRIANARLSYKGRGALADANAQGWLSRFFNSPWFPF